MTDFLFQLQDLGECINLLEQSESRPEFCYRLGIEVDDPVFEEHGEEIANGVAESREYSRRALVNWEGDRIEDYKETILEAAGKGLY